MLPGTEPIGRGRQEAAGGSRAHPSGTGLIPARTAARCTGSPGHDPFSPEQPAPCAGAPAPGEQSSSAAGHSDAISILGDFQDQLEL